VTIIQFIDQARTGGWTDEDGAPLHPVFHPGLDEAAIVRLEKRVGGKLPKDYREVLSICSRIEGLYYEVDLTQAMDHWDVEDFCPRRVGLADDGFGDFWCVDLLPYQEEESAIFFICHDGPYVELEYIGIMPFLEEVAKASRGLPTPMLGSDIGSDLPFARTLSKTQAGEGDVVLQEFASGLAEGHQILDLRGRVTGTMDLMEIEDTPVRHPTERIFAYCKRQKSKGIRGRLFGR
jgi:hypothetical protein